MRAPGLSVRSAGTSRNARRRLSVSDIHWANVIFVMEQKHKDRIRAEFSRAVEHTEIVVLDIPDDYQFMDPELIEVLKTSVQPALDRLGFSESP